MKAINTLVGISVIILLVYFISCEIDDTPVNTPDKSNLIIDGGEGLDKCLILPSNCGFKHFCLKLVREGDDEEMDYRYIEGSVKVNITGTDCNNVSYWCAYSTPPGSKFAMGTYLTWEEPCEYTFTVCCTYDGVHHVGSQSIQYIGYDELYNNVSRRIFSRRVLDLRIKIFFT